MPRNKKGVDKFFLTIVVIFLIFGTLAFVSGALGILPNNQDKFYNVLLNQLAFGLLGGIVLLGICSKIDYRFWRKYSFYILAGCLFLLGLVFVPSLGLKHGGAQRWIDLGPISFQPAEFLKLGFIMYFASWITWVKGREKNLKVGLFIILSLIALISFMLLKQPDTKSLVLILASGVAMAFVSEVASWKHILIFGVIAVLCFGALVFYKPYLLDRLLTFRDPARDPLGSSYQLQQSLIALGAGGVTGRGLGQSIQKFSYLPEPQGDSIFSVIGEELGFIGGLFVIILYLLFAMRGLRIASRAPDPFGRLLVTGIVIMIVAQSFLNIGSLTGLLPLTGVPLVFISQGGTSLLLSLAAVGIILNVSKQKKLIT
jgi:cell division protein FtsW